VIGPSQVLQKAATLTYYYYGADGYAVLRLNQIAAFETLGSRSPRKRRKAQVKRRSGKFCRGTEDTEVVRPGVNCASRVGIGIEEQS